MRALKLLAVLVALALLAVLIAHLPAWFWHPLGDCTGPRAAVERCRSYNFWSGISGANITLPITTAVVIAGMWHRHNCHQERCWRVVRHGKTHCPRHDGACKSSQSRG